MVQNLYDNNTATISGKISSDLVFSHEVYGEGFYYFILDVQRLSDSFDKIPVTVSERLSGFHEYEKGRHIEVEGQFRSYNSSSGEGNRLLLTVFARDIKFIDVPDEEKAINSITLNGYICKPPVYRTTPFGREIADILLAVNRTYNKSDYIPCISWGRNARYCGSMNVGDNVKVNGRIQSREYQKKLGNGEVINKTAFEVSVSKLELLGIVRTTTEDETKEDSSENI
ncbi:MAG: single-stranded DNA-binding protein [Clostridiales bacterium]|jgi:single-stranded DNA-binding protein|nr:single-stranded DNA-binding protein [Clostridiales bacterium]